MGDTVALMIDNKLVFGDDISGYTAGDDSFVPFIINDDDAYLGPSNPTLQFGFTANAEPDTGTVFLNGTSYSATPGVATIPEPSAMFLMATGICWYVLRLKRK